LEVARYFDGDFVGGETTIGYDLNADSFHVTSPGLVAFSSPDVGAAAASVGTEAARTVVDSQGRAVALDLVVRSRLRRGEDGLTLVYEATADDLTQLDGTRFVLAWEAFDLLPGAADAAVTGPSPFRAAATGAFVPVTHRAPGAVSVRVPAGGAAYRDLLTLTVRERGAGGADLLTVVVPAFLPRPRWQHAAPRAGGRGALTRRRSSVPAHRPTRGGRRPSAATPRPSPSCRAGRGCWRGWPRS